MRKLENQERAERARRNERMRKLENQEINRLVDRDEKKRNGSEHLEGYRKGGLSLQKAYRKLIRILEDKYRKGI